MAIDGSLIGKSSEPQTFAVTWEAVQHFMEATEDPALVRGEPIVYAPATFPTTFRVRVPGVELDSSRMQLIHGEQEYEYARRLRVGEEVTCVARIVDVRQRSGRSGPMSILVTELAGSDSAGQQVFSAKSTLIVREK